jgi:proline dehydrogenase
MPWVSAPRNACHDQPLIYATFQAYLRRSLFPYIIRFPTNFRDRTPQHLRLSIEDAKRHHYALGVKLVRGAYHPHEIEYHRKQSLSGKTVTSVPPVWTSKADTDKCYDECVTLLLSDLAHAVRKRGIRSGLLFGTHNWISARKVLSDLAEVGLARVVDRRTDTDLHIEIAQDVVDHVAIGQLFGQFFI